MPCGTGARSTRPKQRIAPLRERPFRAAHRWPAGAVSRSRGAGRWEKRLPSSDGGMPPEKEGGVLAAVSAAGHTETALSKSGGKQMKRRESGAEQAGIMRKSACARLRPGPVRLWPFQPVEYPDRILHFCCGRGWAGSLRKIGSAPAGRRLAPFAAAASGRSGRARAVTPKNRSAGRKTCRRRFFRSGPRLPTGRQRPK